MAQCPGVVDSEVNQISREVKRGNVKCLVGINPRNFRDERSRDTTNVVEDPDITG